jgi:hypothetical protein
MATAQRRQPFWFEITNVKLSLAAVFYFNQELLTPLLAIYNISITDDR